MKTIRPGANQGQGHPSVQRQSSDVTFELRDEHQAEAIVVVAVVGVVVVAVSRPAVLRVVVPTPAANNTVRTLDGCPIILPFQFDISTSWR